MSIIYVLNGPNLNMLGTREPDIYGKHTLADIQDWCARACAQHGLQLVFQQSNSEGELIGWVQEATRLAQAGELKGLIINAGAYTHTSIALHDALKALQAPKIELHISNTFAREAFRHHSYLSAAVTGVICGLGVRGYVLAIEAIAKP